MIHITYTWEGSTLVIRIPDADGNGTPSKTGKMNLTGTTHGWAAIPGTERRPVMKASINIGFNR